mgnify:CR=1 FL=1
MTASDFDRDATGAHPARCGCVACRGVGAPDSAPPPPEVGADATAGAASSSQRSGTRWPAEGGAASRKRKRGKAAPQLKKNPEAYNVFKPISRSGMKREILPNSLNGATRIVSDRFRLF